MRKVSWAIVLIGISFWLSHRFHMKEAAPVREVASTPDPYGGMGSAIPKPEELDEHGKLLAEIRRLQSCYEPQTCDFPKTDPKSYELAVGQKLAAELKTFSTKFSSSHGAEIAAISREMVKGTDAFVQDAALDILSGLPASAENLQAIAEGIQNSPDPSIVNQGMQEMKRYLGTDQESQVHNILGKIMAGGAHFSSQTVATGILPFINNHSYPDYQRTEESMNHETTTARRLKSALEEFHRQNSGG